MFVKFSAAMLAWKPTQRLLSTFWPEVIEKLGHLIHPCPYEVNFIKKNRLFGNV
jgi:hypothetical protein